MADYYPLIARAIAGLDPSAPGESRRALYERARAALIAQLRGVQPPLSEIRNHPRAAVAGRGRAQGRDPRPPSAPATHSRAGGACRARGGDAFRRANARAGRRTSVRLRPGTGSARPRLAAIRRRASRDERPPLGRKEQTSARSAIFAPRRAAAGATRAVPAAGPDAGSAAAADPRTVRRAAPRPRQRAPQTPQPPGMRGFRDIAADADDLGRAAAQANRVGAKDLCQRAVALAGVRPARAEHGEPRRRSGRALFL